MKKKSLKETVKTCYPQINLRVSFKTNNMIKKKSFRQKEQLPLPLRSSVIYKYKCDSCNAVYVGKTARSLKIRISEHKGFSFRTGSLLMKPPFSAIRDHAWSLDHRSIKDESVEVVFSSRQASDLETAEALLLAQKNCSTHP